ncbi:MAG: type II secretion system F family protein [Lachnospiraceae bacterium]|nr:type II secretion system F family protein [Lachnospiraceae bacterium]
MRSDRARTEVRERLMTVLAVFAAGILIGRIFYDSTWVGLFLAGALVIPAWKVVRKAFAERRKARLKRQFLAAVILLGDYLKTGYSVENALSQSVKELNDLYGEKSEIVSEWKEMILQLNLNRTPEETFRAFGEKSGIREIRDFADLFGIVKRSGGQLSEVVRETGAILEEQFSVEEEIRTATAARKLEQKIMDVMPAAIILYIRFSSPELLTPLYSTLFGRILMTVCLALYGFAVFWAERIIDIRFA